MGTGKASEWRVDEGEAMHTVWNVEIRSIRIR
jgi:hypothetical protein